ncbi:MAG TPA: glycosyltransferase family 4 protein [Gemmatimonadales bacterium]
MLNVLHLHSGNLYGGIETILVTLVEHAGETVRHDFVLAFDGRLRQELATRHASVEIIGPVRLSRPWTVRRARRALASFLTRHHPDVCVCHSPWSMAVFGPTVRRARRHLVLCAHGDVQGAHWLQRLAGRVRPHAIVCNSAFTASGAARTYGSSIPCEVVMPPVSPPQPGSDAGESIRRALGESTATVVILMVARMESGKGHRVLLDAIGRMRTADRCSVWLVGGAQRPAERRYVDALRQHAALTSVASRVRFLGERSDVRALYAGADIYCQPNTTPDAFGITFVEALYAGLPIVTSPMGGALEIVDAACGAFARADDATALAETLDELVEDEARRHRLGAAGPARATRLCDPTTQITQFHRALAAAVGDR